MTRRGPRNLTLRCALAALMLYGSTAGAQVHRFDLREQFVRERDPELRPPGLDVQARIDSALLFVGNINLAENSEDEVDVAGIELAPGIFATYRSARADAKLDYSFIGRAFEDDDYDAASHLLSANGSYIAVQDVFFIDAQAGYSDSIIDPAISTNYGGTGLFNRDNVTETASASITPRLSQRLGGFQLDARYTYGRVWYFDSDDVSNSDQVFIGFNDDSEDQRAYVSLGTSDVENAATFKGFYEWQNSEFEQSQRYRYERAGLDTSLRLTETLRLVADGGVETDLTETTTDGGLDSEFWHVGFRWQPDSRTSLDARYGDRFFGESYSVDARYDGRWLTLRASYVEDPEVETRRVGIDFDPTGIPIPPSTDFATLSASPYIRNDAVLTAIAEGARTKIRLDVYDRQRDYLQDVLADEETTGAQFSVVRDIGSELYGEIRLRYEDILRGQQTVVPGGADGLPGLRPRRDVAHHLGGVRQLQRQRRGWLAPTVGQPGVRRRMGGAAVPVHVLVTVERPLATARTADARGAWPICLGLAAQRDDGRRGGALPGRGLRGPHPA